jgi:hypothetical protein
MNKRLLYTLPLVALGAIVWSLNTPDMPETKPLSFDGPDKALVHNTRMMEDRQLGRVPMERLHDARQHMQTLRAQSRDLQWTNWNTGIPGRGRMIYFHEPTGVLLSGSVTGGLWKNTDYKSKADWELVSDFGGAAINCLAADPNNTSVLYAGTGESFTAMVNYRESTGIGRGIYRSDDHGATWSLLTSTQSFNFVNDIVVRNENGTSVLYAAVGSGTYQFREFAGEGLYRSANGGLTWTSVLPDIPGKSSDFQPADIEVDSNNKLWVATMRNSSDEGGGYLLSSTDGTNWSLYNGYAASVPGGWVAGRSAVKASPSNPDHLYALFTRGNVNGLNQLRDYVVELRHSVNGGANWSTVPLPGGWANIPWHALSLSIDPLNENKVIIAALDTYVLNDVTTPGLSSASWIRLSNWAIMYSLYDPTISDEDKAELAKRYVHADIHEVDFVSGNSDDVLITSDGGVFFCENMSITNAIDPSNPVQEFPEFKQLNGNMNTTQFYYARIHPQEGVQQMVGGAQDNGCIFGNDSDVAQESMISGGDGGYCFWDRDNPELKITTVYGNGFYFHVNDNTYYNAVTNGLFVNPMDYDDESNLVYTNAATSTYGGLYPALKTRYFDTLEIVNVNNYLGTPTLSLPAIKFVKLNAGLTEAITAVKLSPHSTMLNKTAFLGTENGKVFKVTGLPYTPITTRIDFSNLPTGYISSIDVGINNDNTLLVTLSNFGLASVWLTRDGGATWKNMERNLPDMPVRWGRFNPFDDYKLLLATEMGVWGLENADDPLEQWQSYTGDLPAIRIDMIDIRESDSTILAATHGHGIWTGKLDQGEIITRTDLDPMLASADVFPNPTRGTVNVLSQQTILHFAVRDLQGRAVKSVMNRMNQVELNDLTNGVYILEGYNALGQVVVKRKVILTK